MLKVLLLGEAGVGKTSLMNQFVNREFGAIYKPTIGSDFTNKQVEIDGQFITLQIWDTAGQERYQSLGSTFYRNTHCCVLVYDVTNLQSFKKLQSWKDSFLHQVQPEYPETFPFLILGNKCDLPNRVISLEMLQDFSKKNGDMLYYEVSAKTSDNVNQGFEKVVQKAIEQRNCRTSDLDINEIPIEAGTKEKADNDSCC